MKFIHDYYIRKIDQYSEILQDIYSGKPVILPTETVYGVGVLEEYAQSLYDIKQRPADMPISIAYPSVEAALNDVQADIYQEMCVKALLPGPFTLLMYNKNGDKVGLRVPNHSKLHFILALIEKPMLLTSANLHKQKPAVSFEEAVAYFPILRGVDGGKCKYSQPSMIIDLTKTRM